MSKAKFIKQVDGAVLVTTGYDRLMSRSLQASDAIFEKVYVCRVSDIEKEVHSNRLSQGVLYSSKCRVGLRCLLIASIPAKARYAVLLVWMCLESVFGFRNRQFIRGSGPVHGLLSAFGVGGMPYW